MRKNNAFIAALLLTTALSIFSTPVSAQASVVPGAASKTVSIQTAVPYFSDVIIRYERIYNGKRQYRRWNDTKKVWVDPHWIDY